MIDGDQLIDRFAEIDFLHELWLKARAELPKQTETLRPFVHNEQEIGDDVLAKMLHKLRGLVSNFLTEKPALAKLVECETLVSNGQRQLLPPSWEQFEILLDSETQRLNLWLTEQGHPC